MDELRAMLAEFSKAMRSVLLVPGELADASEKASAAIANTATTIGNATAIISKTIGSGSLQAVAKTAQMLTPAFEKIVSVLNDHGDHYNWEPNVDLPLSDFVALLATVEPAFNRIS